MASLPERRHRAICQGIRELQASRGRTQSAIDDLLPLTLNELLQLQSQLLALPRVSPAGQVMLFDQTSGDSAA